VVGQLEAAGSIRTRRMFGGVGIYIDDAFCAIIGADTGCLYLKVDQSNLSDYEQESMEPFSTGICPRGSGDPANLGAQGSGGCQQVQVAIPSKATVGPGPHANAAKQRLAAEARSVGGH